MLGTPGNDTHRVGLHRHNLLAMWLIFGMPPIRTFFSWQNAHLRGDTVLPRGRPIEVGEATGRDGREQSTKMVPTDSAGYRVYS